jgi:hypothetical protein
MTMTLIATVICCALCRQCCAFIQPQFLWCQM